MKVRVNLYGTLSRLVTDYNPYRGIDVEVPDGGTVEDLLASLEMLKIQKVVVVSRGRVLKSDDKMQRESQVNVFQAIHGG